MKTSPKLPLTPLAFVEKTLEEISTCDSELKTINLKMDQEMLEIRKKYIHELTLLQEKKDTVCNQLEAFALENQNALFSIKRSLATKFGTFGFRTGKPKFKLLNDTSWTAVTDALRSFLPAYVRVAYEPMKDKLLSDRMLPEVSRFFPALHLTVVQDETFFIDLKKEK